MNNLVNAYSSALSSMLENQPKALHKLANGIAVDGAFFTDDDLVGCLQSSFKGDVLCQNFNSTLLRLDRVSPEIEWTGGTTPNSKNRRDRIYYLWSISDKLIAILEEKFQIVNLEEPIVIAERWDPWYTNEVKQRNNFYWNHYSKYLREQRKWQEDSILSLDNATDLVVERLADPTQISALQTKGLVAGYVQSGKTANFTGVIAKAIDAGYRLIIVLTGTTDILRNQTQRRIDMELIGKENILAGASESNPEAVESVDYCNDDPDWEKFLEHGLRPSDEGRPDITRLTTKDFDYQRLRQGISALDFPILNRKKHFVDPENLAYAAARIAIVKKNASVLKRLVADLRKIPAKLENIPILIIDDESDQASVNTRKNPTKAAVTQRTAINKLISDFLGMSPRVQYIGYTATPFANVFIDPSDAQDIFPSNYLVALPRSPDYMGAADFHDLDNSRPADERTPVNSSQAAHVRLLPDDAHSEEDTASLRNAIDTFVLTGAIKLYRQERGLGKFRHHTMLYHATVKIADHQAQAQEITRLWNQGSYRTAGALRRLQELYETDIISVSNALNSSSGNPSFEELHGYIGKAISKIGGTNKPVLTVNSDKIEGEKLSFDEDEVWRILVGGNKLARGFTVEGLTISYYLRNVKQVDTLMQMGRWFGFRPHYRDLVRLYVTESLYNSFEAVCLDEEFFRDQLKEYTEKDENGYPYVTPAEIPPLVAQHRDGLRPTAANKMYNVRITENHAMYKEPRSLPRLPIARAHNVAQFKHILSRFPLSADTGHKNPFPRILVTHGELMGVLNKLLWHNPDSFSSDLAWLNKLRPDQVADWQIILPQLTSRENREILGVRKLSVHTRSMVNGDVVSLLPGPDRRWIKQEDFGPTRGGMMLYPMVNIGKPDKVIDPVDVVMSFGLKLPKLAQTLRPITFTVIDHSRPNYYMVNAPK